MLEIKIEDVEKFKNSQEEIIKLQKQIEELNEVKKLKQVRELEYELVKKVKKISTYNSLQIGNVIAKLMTKFEGIPYKCKKSFFSSGEYDVLPDRDTIGIYPIYSFRKIENESETFNKLNNESLSLFPPSELRQLYIQEERTRCVIYYIQYFIDFLYQRRATRLLYEITNEELDNMIEEFSSLSKELQLQRKEEIARAKEKILQSEVKRKFENSCLIDRKLMYKTLSYIINHYEKDMIAIQETKEENKYYGSEVELYAYHNLIIKSENKHITFESLVDKKVCGIDDMYCGISTNPTKDSKICFFDLKRRLAPIIEKSEIVRLFMDRIEALYYEDKKVMPSEIEEILIIISNEYKRNKKILKLEI